MLNDEIANGSDTSKDFAVSVYSQLALFWLNTNWDINSGYIEPTKEFIEKSRQAEKNLPDSNLQAYTSYMLQGAYYLCIKQFDSSRYYFLKYLDLRKKNNTLNVTWYAAVYLNIAETYMLENNPEMALVYLDKTMELKEKLAGFQRYLTITKLYYARAYYQLKKYKAGIEYFESAISNNAMNTLFSRELVEAYNYTSDAYHAIGNNDKAFEYKNIYTQLHDSLNKKDRIDMMNRLQIKFNIAEKDKKLAEQNLSILKTDESIKRKNIIISSMSALALLLAGLFILWQRNSKHKQRLQQEQINSFDQKMQIANLNATIEGVEHERKRIAAELHDGIGGLLSAAKINFELVKEKYHLADKEDYNDSIVLLSNAASELRKTAHNMMPEMLIQQGLTKAIELYCNSTSNNSNLQIQFQTAGEILELSPNFELAIYRIVQELVHNIIKHAYATKAMIQIGFSNNIVDITVEDDGIGMPEHVIEKGNGGIGLGSIQNRLKAINGTMHIQNLTDGGTGIYIEIFVNKH